MKTKLLALVIFFLWVMPTFAQVDTAWVRRYNGSADPEGPAGNMNTNNAEERLLLPLENVTVRLRSPSLSGSTSSPPRAGSGQSRREGAKRKRLFEA
jgi:hypothetical protein